MRLNLCLLLLVVILLVGCTPTISNLGEYQPCPIEPCSYMPTPEQLKSSKIKVVIFPLSEGDIDFAKQAKLGSTMAGLLENQLAGGAVEIIDRNSAQKLQKEVKLAEMNKAGSYSGPAVADYAISGAIDNTTFDHDFNEAYTTTDKKGNTYYNSAKFNYKAAVTGKIRIYELPSLRIVKTITFSDTATKSEETKSASDYKRRDDNLVGTAGSGAIKSARVELQNFFAKKGYVLERRAKEKVTIYKISLGSDDDLKTGDTCQIFTINKTVNPITQEETPEDFLLGEGKVSNLIANNYAWIVVDETKLHAPVRLGDYVKVKYVKNLFN